MPKATMTSKGQVTLPKSVREHLRLDRGDRIDFVLEEDGTVRLRPIGGSVMRLEGLLADDDRPALSLEEMKQRMLDGLAADDRRIREGRTR